MITKATRGWHLAPVSGTIIGRDGDDGPFHPAPSGRIDLPRALLREMRSPGWRSLLGLRDTRPCMCGHRSVSHGSHDSDGRFAGIGNASCGIDGCGCQALTLPDMRRRAQRNFWAMLALPDGYQLRSIPNHLRDTRADLTAAHSLAMGADPNTICPVTGLSMARANTLKADWCCHDGHRGQFPAARTIAVDLVVFDLTIDRDGERHYRLVTEEPRTIRHFLAEDDWRNWHTWTANRVRQAARDHGLITANRHLVGIAVNPDRTRRNGWRGRDLLSPPAHVVWNNPYPTLPDPDVPSHWWTY